MKLFASALSPYARKCLILIRKKGLKVEEASAINRGAEGYKTGANPSGKIPALTRPGKASLFDSPIICQYLDGLSEYGEPWLPTSGEDRYIQLRQHALGDSLSDAVYNLRYETVRPSQLHWTDIIERHETAILSIIAGMESETAEFGTSWTYGNLSIVCALGYADVRAPHLSWRNKAPRLAAWIEGFTTDDAYMATKPNVS